jgi:antitoxin component of MazEF toxin-antitoxin module
MKDSMELISAPKLQMIGKSSLAVIIPASEVKLRGLKKGDVVEVRKSGDMLILTFPKDGKAPAVIDELPAEGPF